MKFTKLRLSGFKSFVEPAELLIGPGLTGIVGPNGCGKSNLLEALRWVMGEGSARSLRSAAGGAMDDVIFAGTATRPRRDLAEVSLFIDNRARRTPAGFNDDEDLVVRRSIRRGEGSIYQVNGREVRLRDMQLLFADASTGPRSPALVGQGRVAAIIAARPQERRQLLEEAAEISGLQARRAEAELRLRAADRNLSELATIAGAAETRVVALRRQARQAARYRQLSDSIRHHEGQQLRQQWESAGAALQQRRQDVRVLETQLADAGRDEEQAAAAQAEAAAGLPARRAAEAEEADRLRQLAAAGAALAAERAALLRRLGDLAGAAAEARASLAREQARQEDAVASCARLAAELAARSDECRRARALLPGLHADEERAAAALTAAEHQLAARVETHAALLAEGRSARAAADVARARVARIQTERQRRRQELERLSADAERAAVADALAAIGAELRAATKERDAALRATQAAERAAETARQAVRAVEAELTAAQAEIAGLEAEAAALRRLRAGSSADADGGARRALKVEEGFEAAVAALFGDELDAGLGQPKAPGRHWLLLGPDPRGGSNGPPAGAAPLAAHVEAPAELQRALAGVGLTDGAPEAAALGRLQPGQALVSRQGWLWRWDGYVRPPGGVAAALADEFRRANRLHEIARRIAAPEQRRAAAERELAGQQEALAEASRRERHERTRRSDAERQRDKLAAREDGLRSAAARMDAQRAAVEASIERLAAEEEVAGREAGQAEAAVARLPDSSAAAAEVADARTGVDRARATLVDLRARVAAAERSLADGARDIERLETDARQWQERRQDAAAAAGRLAQRLQELAGEERALADAPARLDEDVRRHGERIAEVEQARQQAAEAVQRSEGELADLDRASRAAGQRVAAVREARAALLVRLQQGESEVAARLQTAAERFGCRPADLPATDDSAEAVAAALTRLEGERERLGAVNLRAEAELADGEDELARIGRERADLETATARLRGSIATLNREGRARLLAVLDQVDGHFRQLFHTLFGGGEAELQLLAGDDPLDFGLEIRAQPPGKKLQSLSLLSGGEQALTALALVFALFRSNAVPVSVLDEVDAPLDDANVERFTRLLRHMADVTETRFLVVTHNPVTMAAMQRLYGVTMREPGVSRLVSVELAEAAALVADA